jgi:hypothetical protein
MRSRSPVAFAAALLALALSFGAPAPAGAEEKFQLDVELGAAWQAKNDVQIPNDFDGTRFSLKDLAGTGPYPAGRIYFTWNISKKHGLRFLLAPFSYSETGTLDEPVRFAGADYAPGLSTDATYKFNSWRATYRYRFFEGAHWKWWIGVTAKVRDAKIELEQGDTSSRDTDLGFVPLLHLAGDLRFAKRWHLILDMDALAGGPGRAIDLAVKLGYDVGDHWSVTGGYRLLEGGADTDDVYNFALFNYGVVGFTYRF